MTETPANLKPEVRRNAGRINGLGQMVIFPSAHGDFFHSPPGGGSAISPGMPAEARVTKMWKQQKGLIPFLFLAFSLYFLWDGAVGYPRNDERFDAHERLKNQPEEWKKLCAERGWKTEPPKDRKGPAKYAEQFWWAGGAGAIGLAALTYWMRQKGTIVRSDEESVTSPRGVRIPYRAVTRLDRTKWKSKGLAYVHYSVEGKPGVCTLDDAKHDPKALDVIVADLVAQIGDRATAEG